MVRLIKRIKKWIEWRETKVNFNGEELPPNIWNAPAPSTLVVLLFFFWNKQGIQQIMAKQGKTKKQEYVGKGKVTPVQIDFIVDRYLSDNNYIHTRSNFRSEASHLIAKSPVQEVISISHIPLCVSCFRFSVYWSVIW